MERSSGTIVVWRGEEGEYELDDGTGGTCDDGGTITGKSSDRYTQRSYLISDLTRFARPQKMQRAEKKADNKPVTTLRIDMQKREDGSRGMPSFSKVTMEEAIAAARKSVEEAKRDVESQKPQWLKARGTKEK